MIRYRDLSVDKANRKKILLSFNDVLKTGQMIDGKSIGLLEDKVAKYCNREHAIAVNSGTSAIYLALRSLDFKKGDEIIVPCIGIVPIVNPMLLLGIKPVFVDVSQDYNINPYKIEDKITEKTKAIMAVNYTGRICNMDEIRKVSDRNNLILIEDGSQSFGAKYKGRSSSSFGDISLASMNAMKIFGSCGEAGMMFTDDSWIASKLRKMKYNGLINKQISDYVSLNFRMNTLQAEFLLNKFLTLHGDIEKRRKIAKLYTDNLKGNFLTPSEHDYEYNVYFTYNIETQDRDRLHKFLSRKNIETRKRDSILLPHQLPNREEYKSLKFPFGDSIAKGAISLPIHNKLKEEDVQYICDTINEFYETYRD